MGEIQNSKCFRKAFHFVPSRLIGSGEDKHEHKDEQKEKHLLSKCGEKLCVLCIFKECGSQNV